MTKNKKTLYTVGKTLVSIVFNFYIYQRKGEERNSEGIQIIKWDKVPKR